MGRPLSSVTLATLVALSMIVAVSGGVAVASSSSAAPGHAEIPTDRVAVGGPGDRLPGNAPAEARSWGFSSSDHAGDMRVEVGTDRASDRLEIVFSDAENHERREVAIDTQALRDTLGRTPQIAYVEHESGEEYTVPVENRGAELVVELEEFSSNTVTFEGEISIDGSPSTDGAQYSYDLADGSEAENFTIDVTGSDATAAASRSGQLRNAESYSIDVGGNTAPRSETVTLTGVEQNVSLIDKSGTFTGGSDTTALSIDGNIAPKGPDGSGSPEVTYSSGSVVSSEEYNGLATFYNGAADSTQATYQNAPATIDQINLGTITAHGVNSDYEVWLADGDVSDVFTSGTKISTGSVSSDCSDTDYIDVTHGAGGFATSGGNITIGVQSNGTTEQSCTENWATLKNGQERADSPHPGNVTVTDDQSASVTLLEGETSAVGLSSSTTSITLDDENGGGQVAWELHGTDREQSEDPRVDVDGDGVDDVTYSGLLADGATHSESVALATGSQSITANTTASSPAGVETAWTEVTETTDPTIEVNGNTTSHSGTLADGSTSSLTTDVSWLQDGANRVNVSLTAPASGPTPQVGLNYSHSAIENVSVTYEGETWSEQYDLEKTFASDQSAATLTIPFTSDRVVAIRDVERKIDNGSWQAVDAYQLDGTTLTVELGDVAAGETHAIRAAGTKVRVTNGSITVTDPTYEGNGLDSEVRIDSGGDGFEIDVSGTAEARNVHYTVDESWQGDPSAVVYSDGSQELHMAPPDGATMRVRTVPIETIPQSSHVEVVVEDASAPEFTLRGQSSEVEITYYRTVSGRTYALINSGTGQEIARDTAESPVSFLASSDSATYIIDTVSSGSGGGAVATTGSSGPISTFAIFAGLAGSIGGFFVLGRRFGARGPRQNAALIAGGALVGIVALEAVTAGSLLGELAQGLGALAGGAVGGFLDSGAGAVASGVGMLLAVYAVHERVELPTWTLLLSVGVIAVFTLENITNGALGVGLAEVSPLLWLGLVFGAIALLWRVLAPRPIRIGEGGQ